jgi:ferredoxin-NADP reductase
METPTARRLVLDVPTWPGNDAGQHVDVRLTAEDGYQATRSYSLASSGDSTRLELVVAEVEGGEVSPFLVHDIAVGDALEVHGPLGAFFVWRPPHEGSSGLRPVQLIAGGSGVVPLLAMVRAHLAAGDDTPFRLLYSVRTPSDVFFRDGLEYASASGALRLDLVYTRVAPPGWQTAAGRLTKDTLESLVIQAYEQPAVFVCGPTSFVEAVASWLVELGHRPTSIRTERFGGT